MALYKRGPVWWMSFSYQGRQVRQSTETGNRKLAEKIIGKIQTEIAEGRWFEKPLGDQKTFDEMMGKYNPEQLKDGFNTMPDGEEIFYISNPALGLWAFKERFN